MRVASGSSSGKASKNRSHAVADTIPLPIAGDDGRFMNKVSVAINPPPKKKPKRSYPDGRGPIPAQPGANKHMILLR